MTQSPFYLKCLYLKLQNISMALSTQLAQNTTVFENNDLHSEITLLLLPYYYMQYRIEISNGIVK